MYALWAFVSDGIVAMLITCSTQSEIELLCGILCIHTGNKYLPNAMHLSDWRRDFVMESYYSVQSTLNIRSRPDTIMESCYLIFLSGGLSLLSSCLANDNYVHNCDYLCWTTTVYGERVIIRPCYSLENIISLLCHLVVNSHRFPASYTPTNSFSVWT